MAQTVTLEFDGPPCQRHDFPLYGGKLDMGRVEAEFGLQRVHVNNLPLGIDPQGLSREEFQPGAVIKITGTMAAGIGSGGVFGGSGGTNVEPFLVTFKKNKKAAEVPFDGIPSWQDLCKAAEKKFLELKAEDFCLKAGKTHLSERMWPGFAAKKASLTIGVISLCKPFSSFQQEEAYSMLGVEEEHAEIDNKAFPLVQYKADAPLTAALQACLGFAKWGDLVAHTGKELALRCCLSNPKQHTKEASKRELISPVIFAAAALIGDVQPGPDDLQLVAGVTVEAEYNVRGTLGRGSVDFVVLHKHFSIVVVEGKLHETLEEHLGQLAAEIRATREQYTRVYHKKRKYEDEGEFKKVPSFGILTNGSRYILYKYNAENKTLVRRELDTSLAQGISAEAAGQAVLPIIRCLMHVIQQQVESMINMPATKKGRTE